MSRQRQRAATDACIGHTGNATGRYVVRPRRSDRFQASAQGAACRRIVPSAVARRTTRNCLQRTAIVNRPVRRPCRTCRCRPRIGQDRQGAAVTAVGARTLSGLVRREPPDPDLMSIKATRPNVPYKSGRTMKRTLRLWTAAVLAVVLSLPAAPAFAVASQGEGHDCCVVLPAHAASGSAGDCWAMRLPTTQRPFAATPARAEVRGSPRVAASTARSRRYTRRTRTALCLPAPRSTHWRTCCPSR